MAVDVTPYSTVKKFLGTLPTWVPTMDQERIAAYAVYDAMYRNLGETFKVIQRGDDFKPIYIPSARIIIEAINRYLAKRWNFAVSNKYGSPEEQAALSAALTVLFAREEIHAKFATQKRYQLVRGDCIWHITADPLKEPGKRISIHQRDPGSYFPIFDVVDDTKVVGCHLVDQFETKPGSGKYVIRRQTYRKVPETSPPQISYEVTWWELAGWDDRDGTSQTLKPQAPPEGMVGLPAFILPPQITSLPVYHIKNPGGPPDSLYGQSELAGLEIVMGAINQGVSDNELVLVMEGLGMFVTNSSPPVDEETGEETDWKLGPGRVVEVDSEENVYWKRVEGVTSLDPSMTHLEYLDKTLREASATPSIAVGRVDVQTAESGVALALEMAPLISKNEEIEVTILSGTDHILYDLSTMWLPAYEGLTPNAIAVSVVDDPLPVNRKAVLDEIIALVTSTPPLISVKYACELLSEKLGYEFPETMLTDIVEEQARLSAAINVDPYADRVGRELQQEGAGAPAQ